MTKSASMGTVLGRTLSFSFNSYDWVTELERSLIDLMIGDGVGTTNV
jgi:hypothetical protein